MIQIQDKQILIDGQPRVVMAGEVHYFRVARDEWEQRILLLKEAGCNAVASYIPWLWHELPDGTIDVTGATRPERDVARLHRPVRRSTTCGSSPGPGPFIMAELKNEGLPFRLYTEHPEIVPVRLGRQAGAEPHGRLPRPGLPGRVRPVVRARSSRSSPSGCSRSGGNVIAVQLDNEIGMLAWVTNSPDLTDHLVDGLRRAGCRTRARRRACRTP